MAQQKQATPGFGTEYEVLIPAFFGLKLYERSDVEDFQIKSNLTKTFGKFDDVVIDVQLSDKTTENNAFQLKHRKTDKNLQATSFTAKGDFNLSTYSNNFRELDPTVRNKYNFCLYTPANFDNSRKQEVDDFNMLEVVEDEIFFDTSSNTTKNVYRFEVNDQTPGDKLSYQDFFSHFVLYTNQRDFQDFERGVFEILKNNDVALKYIHLFRKWHQNKFTNQIIDRCTIETHLMDYFLSSSLVSYQLPQQIDSFQEAIRDYQIIVVENQQNDYKNYFQPIDCYSEENLSFEANNNFQKYRQQYKVNKLSECLLRLAREYKFLKRKDKDKKVKNNKGFEDDSNKSNENENNKDVDSKDKVDEDNKTNEGVDNRDNENEDNKFNEDKDTKGNEINDNREDLDTETAQKIFLYFLQKTLLLNSNTNMEDFLKIYKPKDTKKIFLLESFACKDFTKLKVFQNLEDLEDKTKLLQDCRLTLQGRNPTTLEEFMQDFKQVETIIGAREIIKMLRNDFKIGEKKLLPKYYIPRKISMKLFDLDTILNLIKEDQVIFISNSGGTEKIQQKSVIYVENDIEEFKKKFQDKPYYWFRQIKNQKYILVDSTTKTNHSVEEIIISESEIHQLFDAPLNILTAEPGMGKSTMLTFLETQYPTNFWTVSVDLKRHTNFFSKKHSAVEVLEYFLNETDLFLKKLKDMFITQKRVVFFVDGLDELPHDCIENVFTVIDELLKMNYKIWLSSRENLQDQLKKQFKIYDLNIIEIDRDQQKDYISKRLESLYSKNEIENLFEEICKSIQIVNNSRMLGIPLQLYILTQIFLDNPQHHKKISEEFFVLTKMYNYFFEGRFRHCLQKYHQRDYPFITNSADFLEQYELVAAETLFKKDKDKLKINLSNFKIDNDPLGIISKVHEGVVMFEHETYREYFAAKYFAKNFDKLRLIKSNIHKHENFVLILNILLAEENPLHLSIAYNNFQEAEKNLDSQFIYDKGGRNPLHVALSSHNSKTDDCQYQDFLEEKLIMKFNPYECDELFQEDAFAYGIYSENYYGLDLIIKNYGLTHKGYQQLQNNQLFANPALTSDCVSGGFLHLLSAILDKKDHYECSSLFESFNCKKTNRLEIAQFLINCGASVNGKHSPLREAIENNDFELVKFLLEKGVRFTNKKKFLKKSDLAKAIRNNNLELVNLLLENNYKLSVFEIHVAIERGFLNIIYRLLQELDEDAKTQHCNEFLQSAIKSKDLQVINYIFTLNPDINWQNQKGETTIHVAAESGDLEIFNYLLEKRANLNMETFRKETLLHYAVKGNNIEIVKFLLEKNFNVNKQNNPYKETALFYAIENENIQMVELLLKEGTDVNLINEDGNSVLFTAAGIGVDEIVELLINHNANLFVVNNNQETLLSISLLWGKISTFRLLVEKGLKLDKNYKYEAPLFLHYTSVSKLIDIIKTCDEAKQVINNIKLSNIYEKVSLLEYALTNNVHELIEKLLDLGAEIDCDLLWNCLHCKECTQLFVSRGLHTFPPEYFEDIFKLDDNPSRFFESIIILSDKITKTDLGRILIEMVKAKFPENQIQQIIGKQPDLNVSNTKGRTVLYESIKHSTPGIVELLVKSGASLQSLDVNKKSYWDRLFTKFPINTIKLIISNNNDLNLRDKNNHSPLYHAVCNKNEEIIELLLKKVSVDDEEAFLEAIKHTNLKIVELFYLNNYQIKNEEKKKIMSAAVTGGNCEIIEYLLSRGFDIDESLLLTAAKSKQFNAVKLLIIRGADLDSNNEDSFWNYLPHYDESITELILTQKAKIDLNQKNQNHQLKYAVRCCDEDFINSVLKSRISFEDDDILVEAILRKNQDIVVLLQEAGFKITDQVEEKVANFLKSQRAFHRHKCDWLIDINELYSDLHLAIYLGNEKFLNKILKRFIDLESVDVYNSFYPLHFALRNGKLTKEALIEITKWIDKKYIELRIWKLQEMKNYLLQKFPLSIRARRKSHKFSYLTEEYENTGPGLIEAVKNQ